MTDQPDQPDLLAEVLAGHQPVGWHRTATACACGHRCDPAAFAVHQGDVLADAGFGDLRKPLGEAVEAELARQRAEAALSAAHVPMHVPAVGAGVGGRWIVYCYACSWQAGDYVALCPMRRDWPPAELTGADRQMSTDRTQAHT